MIAEKILLTKSAIKALVLANIFGPNCETDIKKLCKLICKIKDLKNDMNLYNLSQYFDNQFGPISTIINFIADNYGSIIKLDEIDIANIYCCNHIQIVKASGLQAEFGGYKTDYFQKLRDNGFTGLDNKSRNKFLYSCMGKIGRVVEVDGDFIVVIDECGMKLKNIYNAVCATIDDRVAIHYAGAFLKFDILDDYDFILKNLPMRDIKVIIKNINFKTINYKKWLKGNLSQWTSNNIKKLPI